MRFRNMRSKAYCGPSACVQKKFKIKIRSMGGVSLDPGPTVEKLRFRQEEEYSKYICKLQIAAARAAMASVGCQSSTKALLVRPSGVTIQCCRCTPGAQPTLSYAPDLQVVLACLPALLLWRQGAQQSTGWQGARLESSLLEIAQRLTALEQAVREGGGQAASHLGGPAPCQPDGSAVLSGPALGSLGPLDLPPGIARSHTASDPLVVPRAATSLDALLAELKQGLDMRPLKYRPVDLIFSDTEYHADLPHPNCQGLWLEFGVFQGASINRTSLFRERYCGAGSGVVTGFDTFTGLPEAWGSTFKEGAFSLAGAFPPVRPNVELVKGLFSESLPTWIAAQAAGCVKRAGQGRWRVGRISAPGRHYSCMLAGLPRKYTTSRAHHSILPACSQSRRPHAKRHLPPH